MIYSIRMWLICFFLMLSFSCSGDFGAVNRRIKEQVKEGWEFYELLGDKSDYEFTTEFSSRTASVLIATSRVNGVRRDYEYAQEEYYYYVVAFHKKNGDMFSIVFRRVKGDHLKSD